MTFDPDHGFGLLSPDDQEKIELILTERSHGSHGAPALHGSTPDPQTWCNGFVEGMAYNRENWEPIFATKFGFERVAPILMTSDPEEWEKKNVLNPFTELTPLELCDGIKMAALASTPLGPAMTQIEVPSERRILPAEMIRAPAGVAKNINAVADGRFNGAATYLSHLTLDSVGTPR